MKRFMITVLAALLFWGMLPGCAAKAGEDTLYTDPESSAKVDLPQHSSGSAQTAAPTEDSTKEEISAITVSGGGSSRIDYIENVSSVRYITSADQLPSYTQLQDYDEAYFQEHALLIVLETVNSGGVQVSIESISVEGNNALVLLSHEISGDMSTTVMTTWLVWAELDADLNYNWMVENSAVQEESQRY